MAHDVSVVADDWADTTLTWNGRPQPVGPPVTTFSIAGTAPTWYDLDVTAAVAAASSASTPSSVSFVIRQVQRNGPLAYVNPTNHWTADVPELVVERVLGG